MSHPAPAEPAHVHGTATASSGPPGNVRVAVISGFVAVNVAIFLGAALANLRRPPRSARA